MNKQETVRLLEQALREDKAWDDVTSQSLRRHGGAGEAVIRAQERGVLAGGKIAGAVFRIRDSSLHLTYPVREGSPVKPGQIVLRIRGELGSILSAERTALNLLSHLSGIATATHQFVEAVKGTGVPVYDTRKTTPGLRPLEKYAVKAGGGANHRMDLSEAVLLKDNHLKAMKRTGDSPQECLQRLRKGRFKNKTVEMEAQNLGEVWQAIAAGVDVILLDNLGIPTLRKALALVEASRQVRNSKKPLVEISGGMTLSSINQVAQLKPDRISVGMITHSAPALNFNLDIL